MSREYAYIAQPGSITVHFNNGDQFIWPNNHAHYEEVRAALGRGASGGEIRNLMDTRARIEESLSTVTAKGFIEVTRDGVMYKGRPIHMTITERILEFVRHGLDASPQIAFLEKLLTNARREAVLSLYDFIEANKIPITEDGDFIVFKKVRGDYTDIHSGKFDNSIGSKPRVELWEVDPDRENTCSMGLHVCARHYLPSFGSWSGGSQDRVVICKVNPADVVAVPRDYNNSKMRVCAYEVIGELSDEQKAEIFDDAPLVSPGDFEDSVTWGDNFSSPIVEESGDEPHYTDSGEDVPEDDEDEDSDSGEPNAPEMKRRWWWK